MCEIICFDKNGKEFIPNINFNQFIKWAKNFRNYEIPIDKIIIREDGSVAEENIEELLYITDLLEEYKHFI